MSVVLRTTQDIAGSVSARVAYTFNRVFPPKQRERALENLRAFSVHNPKLAVSRRKHLSCCSLLMTTGVSCSADCPSWSTHPSVPCFRSFNSCRFPRHLHTSRYHHRLRLHPPRHRPYPPLRSPCGFHWQLYGQHRLYMGPCWVFALTAYQWR